MKCQREGEHSENSFVKLTGHCGPGKGNLFLNCFSFTQQGPLVPETVGQEDLKCVVVTLIG